MVFDIIIVILLLLVLGGGVFLFLHFGKLISELSSQLKTYQDKKEDKIEFIQFTPYLARVPQETEVRDEEGNVMSTLLPNSFCTVVFEKEDKCQLLSGGWIDKDACQKEYSRIEGNTPAKLKEDTLLRNGASYGYKSIGRLFKGQVVNIKADYGNWYKVATDKAEGYVLKNLLER